MSGWVIDGASGSCLLLVLADAAWTAIVAIGTYLNWLLVAKGFAVIRMLPVMPSPYLIFLVTDLKKTRRLF